MSTPSKHRAPIKTLLIANRGEIARRIARTCRQLGIRTVGVFTDPDCNQPFVREVDASYSIGSSEAYLSIEKILEVAQQSGADAIHPGYGFLSENADFAERVANAGLIFVGPSSHAIRELGNKTRAKEIAATGNVPVSPTLTLTDPANPGTALEVKSFGLAVGFPLVVKAAAGGGGRGMRIVDSTSDIAHELSSASREATRAFGSGTVFIERFISPARHIEVQIAGDSNGDVIALGTRDCTMQRSNQKLIEEAPAPDIAVSTLTHICDAAVTLGRLGSYNNLGTVEFLLSPDGTFYFLEVNTRLQVEHPVTEMVTGLDLVALQIALAQGESLRSRGLQSSPAPVGHAIEARINAEAFDEKLVVSTGKIEEITLPTSSTSNSTLRIDFGVEKGSTVSHHYDSMIGKVIVHAQSRPAAITALHAALQVLSLSGVRTNRDLLMRLLLSTEFNDVHHSIMGTARLFPSADERREESTIAHAISAAVRLFVVDRLRSTRNPWQRLRGWSLGSALEFCWNTRVHGFEVSSRSKVVGPTVHIVTHSDGASNEFQVTVSPAPEEGRYCVDVKNQSGFRASEEVGFYSNDREVWLHRVCGSWRIEEYTPSRHRGNDQDNSGSRLLSPLPGAVTSLHVALGEEVAAGAVVAVLDSMKMEHPLRSAIAGTVTALHVKAGDVVQAGAQIAEVTPSEK